MWHPPVTGQVARELSELAPVEGSSTTVSVAHGAAFEPVSIAVHVGAVVGCSALCDTPLTSAGDYVNARRVFVRCCRFRRMSRPSSLNSSYDRRPLRRILARICHRPRRWFFITCFMACLHHPNKQLCWICRFVTWHVSHRRFRSAHAREMSVLPYALHALP